MAPATVLADSTTTALLAQIAPTTVLADSTTTTLLAPRALTTVLADSTPTALLAVRASLPVGTFQTNIFWFFWNSRTWITNNERIHGRLNHLNTY